METGAQTMTQKPQMQAFVAWAKLRPVEEEKMISPGCCCGEAIQFASLANGEIQHAVA